MTKLYQDEIKDKIGSDVYSCLEKCADTEVALSLRMQLVDESRNKNYYRSRSIIGELLDECKLFENLGLKFSPLDLVNVFFRCKMLFAVQDKDEYSQRVGGGSYVDDIKFIVNWQDKSKGFVVVLDQYLKRMSDFVDQKTMIIPINNFYQSGADIQGFFENLFNKLDFPFVCFIDDKKLVGKHKEYEQGLRKYSKKDAKNFFCYPSIGFTTLGTESYAFFYSITWLRTFLNLLRIAGFVFPAQIDFFGQDVNFSAPVSPVFLGTHSAGCFCWDEDAKKPWEKFPDGNLLISFGYRGASKMWLDGRTFSKIEDFFLASKPIFNCLKNPWSQQSIYDVAPSLDILSSTTQVQDLGAKVLLIYCCLEHMFVPANVTRDNKKFIIGGINALKPELLDWFDQLYNLRCSYAHKGYVLKNDTLRSFVFESMRNTLLLLGAKLSKAE